MRSLMVPVQNLITRPVREPLDLDEVKKNLKFAPTSEDTLIDRWISGARETFETDTDRQCISAVWQYGLPSGPYESVIELPHPPLLEVLSIVYDDGDGVEHTLDPDTYRVVTPSGPICLRGTVQLRSGQSWPTTSGLINSLRITYRAGYGPAAGDVPDEVKDALYMLITYRHGNRSAVQEGNLQVVPLGWPETRRKFRDNCPPQYPLPSYAW